MRSPVTAVLLAGTLQPSPLQALLDTPVLGLPLRGQGTILDAWLDLLDTVGPDGVSDRRIVLNQSRDGAGVEAMMRRRAGDQPHRLPRPLPEPSRWRGVGGVVRDVTDDLDADSIVLILETYRLPPRTLGPLLAPLQDPTVIGVVGVAGVDEPAGAYAFRREALLRVPDVGYYDMKEQLLPALAATPVVVRAATIAPDALRIRDRRSYLRAVRAALAIDGHDTVIDPDASVAPTAVVHGGSIIQAGAIIADGAVVHDSVILKNAVIGGGAVVTRSVIGAGAVVAPRGRVVRAITMPEPDFAIGRVGMQATMGGAA